MFRKSVVVYSSCLLLTFAFTTATQAQVQNTIALAQPRHPVSVLDSNKEQDGLVGAVRRIKTESAKIENDASEGPRELIELTTYGLKGNRIENVSYPASDPVVGKQEYKYDDRGNITEMTVRNDEGSIVSREAYDYEFDTVGNWIKMVTSLMLFENGKLKREPVETTYRTISYYFTEEVAKIVQPPVKNVDLPAAAGSLPQNVEQPNINFPTTENDKSSSTVVGEAPPLQLHPSTPVAKFVDTSTAATETTTRSSTSDESGESTTRSRLLNLKRSAEREPLETPRDNSAQTNSSAKAAPKPVSVNSATESVNSARVENSSTAAAFSLYEKGLTFLVAGNLKDALGAFAASVKLAPSAEVYLNLGDVYLKLEKNTDAEKAFEQSVKLNSENAEAQYGLGLASFRIKRFANARDAFKKATTLAPDMAKAHLGLGLSYLELNQPDAQLVEVRILEKLDKKLAKQLSAASPQVNCGRFSTCQ
ncbi:MAG TPA: tetratricopeptide repeat protein [Pyrinomonadaceae bacterium]